LSIIIKGYIAGDAFFERGSFKMYGFLPNDSCLDKVSLSDYGNITIKGELPTMVEGKEYELEVEYEKKGKYESYVVKRFLNNPMDMNENEAFNFLSELIGEKLADSILKAYPNFVKMIVKGKINEIDTNKVYGLGEITLKKVAEKINNNIMFYNIINEYKEYELTLNQIQKIYDTYNSFDLLKEKMNENPYQCLCSIGGIGFKTADVKILNKNKSLAESKYRMTECIIHILEQYEESGHTWIKTNELYSECSKITPQCMQEFKGVLENNNRVYFDKEDKRVSKIQTYYCEKEIAERLLDLYKEPRIYDMDYSKYNMVEEFVLTDKQKLSLEYANKYNFYVLAGFAGGGKTFSTKALLNMLDEYKYSYVLFAPTGKASKNFNQNTNRPASTIHRGLGFNPAQGFLYNEDNKLPYDYIIVDEATMIDVFLMRSLLRAIDNKRSKLIFICDPAQIPSVGCGNCIQDIINSEVFPVIFLDKVFRYKDGGLAKVATDTRNGESFLSGEGVEKFGDDFIFVPTSKDTLMEKIISAYKKMLDKGGTIDDTVIISTYNVGEHGTYKINSLIQDLVNPSNGSMELSYIRQKFEIKFRINDRVMQIVNNYQAPIFEHEDQLKKDEIYTAIFNGDDGKIIKIGKNKKGIKYMVVDFDGQLILYRDEDIRDLLPAYAISAHRSQGSGYNYVVAITPPTHKFFLNRNLLYVMYTRTKKFIYNIGTVDTIECALSKSENLKRQTHLKDLLIL
jgi:exodeoxyribonuclease V alpha subunit